jgi:hypothetical protein
MGELAVLFAFGLLCARRGGRYPVGAPTVAVGAARRLRCDARSAVAPRNSLRSDNPGESDHEARAARVPTALLALQAASGPRARPLARHGQSTGLPVSGLAFSPPHKSPPPDTAHRAATLVVFDEGHGGAGKTVGGCASAATYAAPRNALAHAGARARREPGAQRRAAAFERRRIPARGFAALRGRQVAKRSSSTTPVGREPAQDPT